jgi:nucleoside 2-deoxyribosyltransferase
MQSKNKVVYVAGPYRAPTKSEVLDNIGKACALAGEVVRLGAVPIVPHANGYEVDAAMRDNGEPAGDAYRLEAGLELLRRCDAVLLVEGWEYSSGTKAEIAEANRLDKPVFATVEQLRVWLQHSDAEHKPSRQEWHSLLGAYAAVLDSLADEQQTAHFPDRDYNVIRACRPVRK